MSLESPSYPAKGVLQRSMVKWTFNYRHAQRLGVRFPIKVAKRMRYFKLILAIVAKRT